MHGIRLFAECLDQHHLGMDTDVLYQKIADWDTRRQEAIFQDVLILLQSRFVVPVISPRVIEAWQKLQSTEYDPVLLYTCAGSLRLTWQNAAEKCPLVMRTYSLSSQEEFMILPILRRVFVVFVLLVFHISSIIVVLTYFIEHPVIVSSSMKIQLSLVAFTELSMVSYFVRTTACPQILAYH
jgi:hypothetical protein